MAKSKGGQGPGGGQPRIYTEALEILAEKMGQAGDAAGKAATAQTGALAPLAGMIDLFSRLSSIPIVGAFTPLLGAFNNLQAKLKAAGDAGLSLGAGLSVAGGFIGAGIAAGQNLISAVKEFAGVLSPQSLAMFDRAVKDTTAAVGVALLPVLQTMTLMVREAGELILPIARQLEPVFRRIAEAGAGQLSRQMEALAGVVEALLPLFDALAAVNELMIEVNRPVIDGLRLLTTLLAPGIKVLAQEIELVVIPIRLWAQVMGDAMETVRLFSEALAAAFDFRIDLSDVLGGMQAEADRTRDAFRELMKTMLLLSAAILKTIDSGLGNRFIEGLLKSNQGPAREDTRGLRPAENAHFVDMAQWGKDVLQAASMAGFGGTGKKTQEELLDAGFKDVLAELKDSRDFADRIIKGVGEYIQKLPKAIYDYAKEQATSRVENIARPGWEASRTALRQATGGIIPGL